MSFKYIDSYGNFKSKPTGGKVYWLGTLLRWVEDGRFNYGAESGDFLVQRQEYINTSGKKVFRNTYYRWEDGTWRSSNSSEFKELGGLLPEDPKVALAVAEPLPFALGTTLSDKFLFRLRGGEGLKMGRSGNYDFIDRSGGVWVFRPNTHDYMLKMLGDGTTLPSEWDTRIWHEGDVPEDVAGLFEAGFEYKPDPRTRKKNLINYKAKAIFLYNPVQDRFEYHVIPPAAWKRAEGPYFTYDQILAGTYEFVLACKGGCDRWFVATQLKACAKHMVCAECVIKNGHRHCANCGRFIDNSQPAIPANHHAALAETSVRSCGVCEACFHCVRECLYCPPNKAGRYACRTCCKNEHYQDEDDDGQAMNYIRDYNDQHYPVARPPFPQKRGCNKCQGEGIVYNPSTSLVEPCPTCKPSVPVAPALWMGVELEVEVSKGLTNAARTIGETWIDSVILKRDSTIRHGFEVVTGPFSLAEHTKLWPNLSRDLVKLGCRSWKHTNTGLHVHCNWEFLNQDELCRYNVFLNEPAVKREIVKIAGRESIFAALKPKKLEDGRKGQALPHREALNITTHRGKTFELRLFKGTLALEHIMADIQFVHSSVHWIKLAKFEDLNKWAPYWSYVNQHSAKYGYLIEHFNRQVTIEKSKEDAA